MDQDALAGMKLGAIDQTLPRGECRDRDGGGFYVREIVWFWRDAGGLGDAKFGEGAVGEPVVHAVDFLADVVVAHVRANRGDDATKFVGRNRVCARTAVLFLRCGRPDDFGGRNAGGVNAD